MVEELLPATVSLMAEVDMNERIMFWLDRFCDKCQAGLFWALTAFSHVAFRAGANYIAPDRFATHTFRDDVVE